MAAYGEVIACDPNVPFIPWLVEQGRLTKSQAKSIRDAYQISELDCLACGQNFLAGDTDIRRPLACPKCGAEDLVSRDEHASNVGGTLLDFTATPPGGAAKIERSVPARPPSVTLRTFDITTAQPVSEIVGAVAGSAAPLDPMLLDDLDDESTGEGELPPAARGASSGDVPSGGLRLDSRSGSLGTSADTRGGSMKPHEAAAGSLDATRKADELASRLPLLDSLSEPSKPAGVGAIDPLRAGFPGSESVFDAESLFEPLQVSPRAADPGPPLGVEASPTTPASAPHGKPSGPSGAPPDELDAGMPTLPRRSQAPPPRRLGWPYPAAGCSGEV